MAITSGGISVGRDEEQDERLQRIERILEELLGLGSDELISIYTPDNVGRYLTTSWPEGTYYLTNLTDETGLTTASGYSGIDQYLFNFELVEGWNPD